MLLGARTNHPVNGKTGVQIRPKGYATFKRQVILEIPCGLNDWYNGFAWLKEQIGKPYDRTGLYRAFLFNSTNWRHDGEWWCSELGMAFLEHCGFPKALTPANRITPNDLFLYAGAVGGYQVA